MTSIQVKIESENLFILNLFIYLFFRERGKEGERERNINVWLPLECPPALDQGAWPETQACALNENETSNPLVHCLALNPLSYTSQGQNLKI